MLRTFAGFIANLFWPFGVRGSKPAPPITIDHLYVLHVDFSVSKERGQEIQGALDTLRDKYGIDFLILEPGMRVARFDE